MDVARASGRARARGVGVRTVDGRAGDARGLRFSARAARVGDEGADARGCVGWGRFDTFAVYRGMRLGRD